MGYYNSRFQHTLEVRVHCPACHKRMHLDPQYPPNTYSCPDCGGCVNVKLDIDPGRSVQCGALHKGMTCGRSVLNGDMVCGRCQEDIAREFAQTRRGAEVLGGIISGARLLHERRKLEQQQRAEDARRRAETKAATEAAAVHVVYYVRLGRNHIKIGTTGDLRRRMTELRVVNDTNLLAAEPGNADLERQRHDQFRKWRYHGRHREDFAEAPDLLAHIRDVRAEHGDPHDLVARILTERESAEPPARPA